MPQMQMTLDNLRELHGGRAALAFDHALKQIVSDIIDRPGEKSKRKVVFTVEGTPILDKTTAVLDNVGIQIKVVTGIPTRQTQVYPMKVTGDGVLLFQSNSPNDPDQHDLPFIPETLLARGEHLDPQTGEVTGAGKSEEEPETQDI
jgi:hypothetical protein